jgi:hypothetical protein
VLAGIDCGTAALKDIGFRIAAFEWLNSGIYFLVRSLQGDWRKLIIMNTRTASVLTLLCLSVVSIGASSTRESFLAKFSLHDTVCALACPGIDCSSERGGGGIGGQAGSAGGGGTTYELSHSSSEVFALDANKQSQFVETEFLEQLRVEIERQIDGSGLQVRSREEIEGHGFRIEYGRDGVSGELAIRGRIDDGFYSMELKATEKAEE